MMVISTCHREKVASDVKPTSADVRTRQPSQAVCILLAGKTPVQPPPAKPQLKPTPAAAAPNASSSSAAADVPAAKPRRSSFAAAAPERPAPADKSRKSAGQAPKPPATGGFAAAAAQGTQPVLAGSGYAASARAANAPIASRTDGSASITAHEAHATPPPAVAVLPVLRSLPKGEAGSSVSASGDVLSAIGAVFAWSYCHKANCRHDVPCEFRASQLYRAARSPFA